ncbi:MAG: peptidylprolyl isomerase [Nitriliruptoraceae bacterium]
MRSHPNRLAALLASLVLVLAACGDDATATGAAATVNGVDIPRSQLDDAVDAVVDANPVDPSEMDADERAALIAPVQHQVLGLLIQAQIIAELAESYDYVADDDAVQELYDAEVERQGGAEDFEQALSRSGLTSALFLEVFLPTQLRAEHIRDGLVAEAGPLEQRTVRHILVATQDEADEIVDELAQGGDFAALAEEHSTDEGSAVRGGVLGPASRGAYVPEFDEAAWTSSIGEVVGPIETQFGFHVIEVTDETVTAPEDLGPQQRDQAVGAELGTLIESAFRDAEVEIAPGLGVWDPDTAQVVAEDQVGTGSPDGAGTGGQ